MSAGLGYLDTLILGAYAHRCKAPAPCTNAEQRKTSNAVIAENLRALMTAAEMTHKDGEPNQSTLARACGADQRTIGRVLACELSPSVEMLEKLARPFGLHAWQMLIPELDPRNPPVVVMSASERDFYRRLEELRKTEPPPRKYITN